MTTPIAVHEWHGTNPPEIRTLRSLNSLIPPLVYEAVYWIAKVVDNVVMEYYSITDWYFTGDGRLIGDVDTGAEKRTVDIGLDEYVVLSVYDPNR